MSAPGGVRKLSEAHLAESAVCVITWSLRWDRGNRGRCRHTPEASQLTAACQLAAWVEAPSSQQCTLCS